MADRKKAIKRLTALSSRLQMLGAALALVGVMSTVQLFRTEILVKPESPAAPTQIQATVSETTAVETTVAETAPAETPVKETPAVEIPAAETPAAETPAAEIPAAETPAAEIPAAETPAAETPAAEIPTDVPSNNIGDRNGTGKIPENGSEDNEPGTKKAKAPQGLPCPPLTDHVPETEPTVPELPEKPEQPVNLWLILAILSDGLLILDLIAIAVVQKKLKKLRKGPAVIPTTERIPWHAVPPEIGKVHGIGGRGYQQDSLGHTQILNGSGVLAIVADGMGGLSNGEQISQQIVMDGLGYGAAMTGLSEGNPLLGMVRQINTGVNRMLGPERIYKCGSTLISVLIAQDQFHWVSVGDSRIYLYREGFVNQLNTDHDLFQQWMPEILAGTRSYAEAARNPDGRKLTSFIGMGELKYVDYSRQPIDLRQGDRLVLVTDGVYGAVPPEQLADILKANPEVSDAAKALERRIRDARMPHQDNYTALILGF